AMLETSTPGSSQTMLEGLEKENLFVVALDEDRRWYRYHHLFADVLRARFRTSAHYAKSDALHRAASRWLADHAYAEDAIALALRGRVFDQAIELLERAAMRGWMRGLTGQREMERWLTDIPRERIASSGLLCYARATHIQRLDPDAASEWLD